MKGKALFCILIVSFMVPAVLGEWVEPVDCTKLLQGNFASKTEFTEEEALCFYGTGYTPDSQVTVALENNERTLSKQVSVTHTGVLTSVKDSVSSLVSGVYSLFVRGDTTVKYPDRITVTGDGDNGGGDDNGGDDGDNGGDNGGGNVPEFTTIAAGLALIGSGIIAYSRRRKEG